MKKKKAMLIFASIVLLISAFVLISYPLLSNHLSEKYHSEVRSNYYHEIEELPDQTLWNAEKEAVKYNGLLSDGISDNSKGLVTTDYNKLLNLNSHGIMAYVEIPAINVYLPIAHGTDAKTLEKYVGHVTGSSLPVGGKGTHTVLSGHSGLANQVMFNDLGQLKSGDKVYIHVLEKVLAYEVDDTNTVLPSDVSLLSIHPDKDELTLITCTPIAVNTHRLLVHCHRIEYTPAADEEISESEESEVPAVKSDWKQQYIKGICLGAAILALFILSAVICKMGKKKRRAYHGAHL